MSCSPTVTITLAQYKDLEQQIKNLKEENVTLKNGKNFIYSGSFYSSTPYIDKVISDEEFIKELDAEIKRLNTIVKDKEDDLYDLGKLRCVRNCKFRKKYCKCSYLL
jgi:hypothetical protein